MSGDTLEHQNSLSLNDIPWDDILYRTMFPMLPWRSIFSLRCTSRDMFNCVNQYFDVCRRLNLALTGPKMNADTLQLITRNNASICILILRNFKDWLTDAVLYPVVTRNDLLVKLDINNCSTLGLQTVLGVASTARNLQEIQMKNCTWLTSEAVISLAHGCPQLSHLDVSGCWNVTDEAVIVVSVACRRLRFLSVARVYGITDHSIKLVARNCGKLTHLNIQGCWRVTNYAVSQVGEYCKQLRMLQVKDCRDINDISLAKLRGKGVIIDVPGKKWELGESALNYLGKINLSLQT